MVTAWVALLHIPLASAAVAEDFSVSVLDGDTLNVWGKHKVSAHMLGIEEKLPRAGRGLISMVYFD